METVLIYTDTQRIALEKNHLTNSVVFFQSLYDALKGVEVTATLNEISNLIQQTVVSRRSDQQNNVTVESFVKSKLLVQAGSPDFNGVPIAQNKIADLIEIPDVSTVLTALNAYYQIGNTSLGFRIDLMEFTGDTIGKKAGTDATITALFTYNTKNDKGAEITTKLIELCTKLNSWQAYQTDKTIRAEGKEVSIRGVELFNNAFRPSLQYIRAQESAYPTYVAV